MKKVNEILRRAMSVAKENPTAAIQLLNDGLTDARLTSDYKDAVLLAKNAAAVCTGVGELAKALSFYNKALSYNPEDAYILYAIGDIHLKMGDLGQAKKVFIRSLNIGRSLGDKEVMGMATTALSRLEKGES